MLFNSIEFFVFFPLAVFVYFQLKDRYRVVWLLLCSCYFYMVFRPVYILILALTIVVDYFAGLIIERTQSRTRKRLWLIASILANMGILAFFKYYNFFAGNVNALSSWLHVNFHSPLLNIILPIGLSFHTFQALSYTIEVYRGRQRAEKKFLNYALYVMFFPQLVAGPVERPQNLLHQFHEHHTADFERIGSGVMLIIWGLFKKMVVADRIAPFVDLVYNNPQAHSGPQLLGATLLFAFQIYYDFSAYSDIARGAARVLGFELMKNFNRPYASRSIADFWRRWHISLSTWFKDYLYIPLGGNRVAVPRMYFNLIVVFLLSGLWHGANWTFVLWGLLNGAYLVFSHITALAREKFRARISEVSFRLMGFLSWLWVFVLINLAWVLFRVKSLHDAAYVFTHLLQGWPDSLSSFTINWFPAHTNQLLVIFLGIGLVELVEWGKVKLPVWPAKYPGWTAPALFALVILILIFGSFQNRQFIYFQF